MIFIMMIITLVVGTLLSFQSNDLLFSFAIYYALSLFVLKSLMSGDDFFLTFQKRIAEAADKKLLVAGHEIASNVEGDKQEDRFLNLFESKRMIKASVLNFVFFIGSWFFYYKSGAEISVNTIIPMVSGYIIINSFYVGHLLFVLLLNVALVAYNYSTEIPVLGYFLYCCSFLGTLYLISNHKGLFNLRKSVSLISIAGLFVLLCFGFTWIMPDTSSLKSEITKNDSRVLRNYLRQSKMDLTKLQGKVSQQEGSQELAKRISQSLADIGDLQKVLPQMDFSDEEKAMVRQKMQDLMEQQNSHQANFNELTKTNSSNQTLSPKERELFNALISKSAGKLTSEERDMLRSYMNRSLENIEKGEEKARGKDLDGSNGQVNSGNIDMDGNSGEASGAEGPIQKNTTNQPVSVRKEQIDAVSKLLEKEELTPGEKQTLNESLKQVIKSNQVSAKKETVTLSNQAMKPEVLKALEPKHEKPMLFERFKRYLPFFVGLFLFVLINYFLRKKGVKTIEVSDPEILEELKAEWKELRKLKLSPREEVIHYYNLFHDSLQKIHYPDHEAPPSCIIYADMKINNAELDKSTLVITEVFAQCYYGDKNVTSDALKLFRKALNRILNVYKLN